MKLLNENDEVINEDAELLSEDEIFFLNEENNADLIEFLSENEEYDFFLENVQVILEAIDSETNLIGLSEAEASKVNSKVDTYINDVKTELKAVNRADASVFNAKWGGLIGVGLGIIATGVAGSSRAASAVLSVVSSVAAWSSLIGTIQASGAKGQINQIVAYKPKIQAAMAKTKNPADKEKLQKAIDKIDKMQRNRMGQRGKVKSAVIGNLTHGLTNHQRTDKARADDNGQK